MNTYLLETTKWDNTKIPNHTYIMNGSSCVGYIKRGTTEEIIFSTPINKFDKRKRTFKKVK